MKVNKYFLIIVMIIILVTVFHTLRWPFFIGKIFYPFQILISYFDKKIDESFNLIFTKKNLLRENEKLKKEITSLIVENIRLKIIEEENEKLKKELDFVKKENYKSVLANIIGKKEEGGIEWFILDQGENSGIRDGWVVVKEGVVVGKIIKTTKNFSYLLPLFDERVKLAVMIISQKNRTNENKVEGIVRGKHGLSIELDLVPLDKKIEEGDFVLTSGLEYNVPKGLFVGILKEVEDRQTDIFHKAQIETPLRLGNLEIVNIIIPRIEREF